MAGEAKSKKRSRGKRASGGGGKAAQHSRSKSRREQRPARRGDGAGERGRDAARVSDESRGAGAERAAPVFPSNRFLLLLAALRVRFLGASALPVLVGSALPLWLRPAGFSFGWAGFWECLVAMVLLHTGANVLNDYHDHKSGVDQKNPNRTHLSGGSGILQAGLMPPGVFLRLGVGFLVVGAALGLHLNAVTPGNTILVLGIIGVFLGYFYTAPPLRLSYRGLGEVAVGLSLGVLPILGSYYVQARTLSWRVALASLPLAFAVVLVLLVNEVVDCGADRAGAKRTLVVILGERAAGRGTVATVATLIYASLFAAVFTASMIPLALVAVLAFGLARTVVADLWKFHANPKKLLPAQQAALKLHLAVGLILAASPLVGLGS